MKQLNINVHHITRVEGHGNIVVNYNKGVVEDFKLEIVESPRFFEVMLKGRQLKDAPQITGRICGICSVGHTLSSLKACENALGLIPSEQTIELRKIILNAEIIQSHILHVYFLVLPDFLNVTSVIPLAHSHPEEVKRALRLKKLGNDMCEILVGRKIHPLAMQINGFSRVPTKEDLLKCKLLLESSRKDINKMVDLFSSIKQPDFEQDTEYIALTEEEYGLYDGKVTSTMGKSINPEDYLTLIQERVVEHSSAKHVKATKDTYMVGALARLNLSADKLHPQAKNVMDQYQFKTPCNNTFHNNTAQVIETVHCVYDSIDRVDKLLNKGLQQENYQDYNIKAGRGVGICEVPRGILIHDYTVNKDGYIEEANCIIPTGQNLANIESNLRKYVPEIIGKSENEITHDLEMMVRAYDPCISCSSHFLDVQFIK